MMLIFLLARLGPAKQQCCTGGRPARATAAFWLCRPVCMVAMAMPIACSRSGAHDGDAKTEAPVAVIDWPESDGFREWGQTGDGFFGTSADDKLTTWKWEGAAFRRDVDAQLPPVLHVVALPHGVYLAEVSPTLDGIGRWPLTLALSTSNEVLRKWNDREGWQFTKTGASANGRFAAVISTMDVEKLHRDEPLDNLGHRIGLIDLASKEKELRWVAEFQGQHDPLIRQIRVSNDGRYVAVGGWANGVLLADAVRHEVLWNDRPPKVISIGYVAFAADGQTLYEADAGGEYLYAVETKSGKILRQLATTIGMSDGGRRASCLAVSPDGAWLAVGTGPDGQVFLVRTASPDDKPIVLPHGLSTILMLSFSPDSRRLASEAGHKIKIWTVPSSGGPQPASGPSSSPAETPGKRPGG